MPKFQKDMDYFPMHIDFTSAKAFGNGCVIYFYTVGFLRSSMTIASNAGGTGGIHNSNGFRILGNFTNLGFSLTLMVLAKSIFKGVWKSLLLKNTEMPGTIVKKYFNISTNGVFNSCIGLINNTGTHRKFFHCNCIFS